ncbi:MAG: hypothetical protein AAGB93_06660, partial [Planctomycetota bacterium]
MISLRSLPLSFLTALVLSTSPAVLAQDGEAPAPTENAQEGETEALAPPADVAAAIEMSESLP